MIAKEIHRFGNYSIIKNVLNMTGSNCRMTRVPAGQFTRRKDDLPSACYKGTDGMRSVPATVTNLLPFCHAKLIIIGRS
jgi:hypothetical protein